MRISLTSLRTAVFPTSVLICYNENLFISNWDFCDQQVRKNIFEIRNQIDIFFLFHLRNVLSQMRCFIILEMDVFFILSVYCSFAQRNCSGHWNIYMNGYKEGSSCIAMLIKWKPFSVEANYDRLSFWYNVNNQKFFRDDYLCKLIGLENDPNEK